jgi:hypothetical protein
MSDQQHDPVSAALLFAKQLADSEISSIERIHNRTLRYIGFIGVFVAAAFAFFGFIGYTNLKEAAIASAESQMKKEVTTQVQDKLTEKNINKIVKDQINDYSVATLNDAIHKELSSPPLSISIRQAAADEARTQISKQFSPRHFRDSQSKAFIKYIEGTKELIGYTVEVTPAQFNIESKNYAKEIEASVRLSKLKPSTTYVYVANQDAVEGVAIYREETSPEIYAHLLQSALAAAGVSARIISGTMLPVTPQGQNPPLVIFVGPRQME